MRARDAVSIRTALSSIRCAGGRFVSPTRAYNHRMQSDARELFATHPVASCRGLDEAREVLSDVFLPVDFPSARATRFVDLQLNALSIGQVTLGYMRFQNAVRIETAEARNYHIDIPTSGRATMRAGLGSPVYGTQRTAGVFMPGRPVELDCAEYFSQVSLMIPRDQLQLELQMLIGEDVAQPLEFGAELDVTLPGGQAVLQAVRLIDDVSAQQNGPLSHSLAIQRLEQVLLHTLLFSQRHNHSAALTRPSPATGTRPVSHAVELLHSDPARAWTVAELATEVSASVRSLQEGFRRSLSTTPMTYLRHIRLEKVHEELVAATPDMTSVSEVAARWGFVHFGRFAAAYRSAFVELPSDTLRSASRRRSTIG